MSWILLGGDARVLRGCDVKLSYQTSNVCTRECLKHFIDTKANRLADAANAGAAKKMKSVVTLRNRRVRHCGLFIAVMWLLAGPACKSGAPGIQHARPDALIVLPEATGVRDTDENAGTVVYQLNET